MNIPLDSSLFTVSVMTRAQHLRAQTLAESFTDTQTIRLFPDPFSFRTDDGPQNICFRLMKADKDVILEGLIEPDGSSHT